MRLLARQEDLRLRKERKPPLPGGGGDAPVGGILWTVNTLACQPNRLQRASVVRKLWVRRSGDKPVPRVLIGGIVAGDAQSVAAAELLCRVVGVWVRKEPTPPSA